MPAPATDPRTEQTRRRLIAAGLELFGRHGFDAVTTRQLAEAAGVNQAAIPYHFGGKQGVYLAVAEHVAARTAERVGPLLAAAGARLAAGLARTAAGALLLEVTREVARAAFEPDYRSFWAILLVREEVCPSQASERLYAALEGPVHELAGELIGRLTGCPATAPETILLAHAYLSQFVGFVAARDTLTRRLGGAAGFGPDEAAAAIAAIERFSRYAIAGMGGGQADATVPPAPSS